MSTAMERALAEAEIWGEPYARMLRSGEHWAKEHGFGISGMEQGDLTDDCIRRFESPPDKRCCPVAAAINAVHGGDAISWFPDSDSDKITTYLKGDPDIWEDIITAADDTE